MIEELEQISLFNGLSCEQMEAIAGLCDRKLYNDGDFLITEGDGSSSDLYILLSGSVEIVSSNAATTSSEVVLSREDKEIFGEISWLTGARRTAGVRCHGAVEAIRIDGGALMQYLENEPEAGFHVTRKIAVLLSMRMEDSNRLLKQLLWNRDI